MNKLYALISLLIVSCLTTGPAMATPAPGKDFVEVSLPDALLPQADVVEFFWYGSASSRRYLSLGQALQRQNPTLSWRYVPAVMRTAWRPQAKAFYLAFGDERFAEWHEQLFQLMAEQPDALADETAVVNWFINKGGLADELRRTYLSGLMNQQLAKDSLLVEQLQLPGVPALLIGGRYLVHAGLHKRLESFDGTVVYLLGKLSKSDTVVK